MIHNSKFVFFGSPKFAAAILEKLITAGHIPALVVCNPDKPVGRKKIITPPPVKERIANGKWQIEIAQPENIEQLLAIRHKLEADFFVVAAYAKIIPQAILDIPKKGVIGAHPSLLPRYRGATPIQSAILHGEEKTGTTLFMVDSKVDHGPILAQKELNCELGSMNYKKLEQELAQLSGDLLIETLPRFLHDEITPAPQDDSLATYTAKFTTEDGYIPYETLETAIKKGGAIAQELDRKIRALSSEPGTYTLWPMANGKTLRVKLLESKLIPSPSDATRQRRGSRLGEARVTAAPEAAHYTLHVTRLVPEGKKPMTWKQYESLLQ